MTLEKLVTELTAAGLESLDREKLNELKKLCKGDRSGATVVEAFTQLFKALHKGHAQVRVSALQAIDELFERSHQFRLLVVEELPQIIGLTMGAYQKKLPPPSSHAKRLKAMAAECLYKWVERFGFAYQRLVYGLRYMRFAESVDFRPAARSYKIRDPERIKRKHEAFVSNRQEYMRRTLFAIMAEFLDKKREMERTLVCVNSCFEALVPDIASMFSIGDRAEKASLSCQTATNESDMTKYNSVDDDDDDDLDEIMAVMAANRHAIHLEFDPEKALDVEETPDNTAIYDAVRDHVKVCARIHRPIINMWIGRLDQINDDIDGVTDLKASIRQLSDRMTSAISKCKDLGVDLSCIEAKESEESSDDEFEDVPISKPRQKNIRGDEDANTAPNKRKRNAVFALLGEPGLGKDPTVVDPKILRHRSAKLNRRTTDTNSNDGREEKVASSNTIEDKLRESAPVVRYDTDLMYWNSGEINANTSGLEIRHRFLGSAHEEPIVPENMARRMRMRAVYLKDYHSHSSSDKAETG
ncbi:hypothetical protein EV175_003896 [Coemansia sp. RSA 1933]|nr:hypothetical protein EV175_003896 [Coemansia sp. RSA 1933]